MWYRHTVEYYSGTLKRKKEHHLQQHGPRDCHTDWSQSNRGGEISYDIYYMWNLKRNDTNKLTKQRERRRERASSCQGEGQGKGIVREFGMGRHTLLYVNGLAHGTLLNVRWQPWWGGGFGENGYMYMRRWIPLLPTWNYHTMLISYIQYKIKS